jgi:predicted kinase
LSLIVFAGLPGAGKTSIARELARRIGAVYVRIDSIEQALRDGGFGGSMDDAGYRAAYAIAADNLRLGHTVVADSVNPIQLTRDAWRDVGEGCGATVVEIEVVCSDSAEHRRRVESRAADIEGLTLPTWADVMARHYEPWNRERVVIDTAGRSVEACVQDARTAAVERL